MRASRLLKVGQALRDIRDVLERVLIASARVRRSWRPHVHTSRAVCHDLLYVELVLFLRQVLLHIGKFGERGVFNL